MSETNAPARVRRFLPMCAVVGLLLSASHAAAATALVRWLPRGGGTVTSYRVYVRNAGSMYGSTPHWSGHPTPAADGSMSATVTYSPAASGADYFAVVAVGAETGETGLSAELPLGTSNPCRVDSCSSKTSCDFSNRADGTSCDDEFFCNGPEVCLRGVCDTSPIRNCSDTLDCSIDTCDETADRCVHSSPPGCCLACDSADPCLALACAVGECSADAGTEIAVNRIRFMAKAHDVKLAAKGSFVADPSIDPTETGVVLEFRAPDGTILYSSQMAAQSIRAGASGGRYRFTSTRAESDFLGNGMTRLDLRIKGSKWLVTAKAETAELLDAFLEPTLTWVIKLGTNCVRRRDMPCAQKETLSLCR